MERVYQILSIEMVSLLVSGVTALITLSKLWVLAVILFTVRAITRKYWTPIRDIPGPFLASFSTLWQVYHLWKGHIEDELIDLHQKNGRLVCHDSISYFNKSDRVFCSHCREWSQCLSPRRSKAASPCKYSQSMYFSWQSQKQKYSILTTMHKRARGTQFSVFQTTITWTRCLNWIQSGILKSRAT